MTVCSEEEGLKRVFQLSTAESVWVGIEPENTGANSVVKLIESSCLLKHSFGLRHGTYLEWMWSGDSQESKGMN